MLQKVGGLDYFRSSAFWSINNYYERRPLIQQWDKVIQRLKNNKESREERKYALNYLKNLILDTRNKIQGGLWEKIEL